MGTRDTKGSLEKADLRRVTIDKKRADKALRVVRESIRKQVSDAKGRHVGGTKDVLSRVNN